MRQRKLASGGWVNIITHIHTDASTAETSVLNDRIGAAIRRCAGEDTRVTWAECFTPIDKLEQLVRRGVGGHGPVHMILVTDHMRAQSHRLPRRHIEAAARTRRLALGAELFTRTRDVDGRYRRGPEILAFGRPHLVEGPHGAYYGLSQRLIEELYDTCLDDDRRELCTRRARDLLVRRGVAHALSHPLDGHNLSMEGTLNVISEFAFVETTNGGYSAHSARVLDAYIRVNNGLLSGATLPEDALGSVGQRIVSHILRHGRPIRPLSGSDAHSHDFDRAVTSMITPRGCSAQTLEPGDFFDSMLSQANGPRANGATGPFIGVGRAATLRSLLADVTAIIMRNVASNLRHCWNPITWSNIAATTFYITQDELRRQHQQRRDLVQQMEREFNPERLLPLLIPASEREDARPNVVELPVADGRRRAAARPSTSRRAHA